MKRICNNQGMTLIEVLAVLVILGIVAAIAVPATANVMEKSRVKAEKSNAIELINAANMYFIENPHHDTYINSVGVPTLVSTGYLDDFFLANDSFWMADAQPSWICGMAVTKKNRVEFRRATVKMILESGDSLQVGHEACGNMEALP